MEALGTPFIVYRDKVLDELKVSDEQREKLMQQALEQIMETGPFLDALTETGQEREQKLNEHRKNAREKLAKHLKEVLDPGQLARLRQLKLQQEGGFALGQEDVRKDLKISQNKCRNSWRSCRTCKRKSKRWSRRPNRVSMQTRFGKISRSSARTTPKSSKPFSPTTRRNSGKTCSAHRLSWEIDRALPDIAAIGERDRVRVRHRSPQCPLGMFAREVLSWRMRPSCATRSAGTSNHSRLSWLSSSRPALLLAQPNQAPAAIRITTPMPPPDWALLERELLRRGARLAEFLDRYFDDAGYLECVERWGATMGPTMPSKTVNDWPVLYALGGAEPILTRFKKAWEGRLRQYTKARTTDVPFARDGMFYKEFHVMFDWFHLRQGLSVFDLEGLCDPRDSRYQAAGRGLCRVLHRRRSGHGKLRSQGQDHPQLVQR